MSRRSYVQPIPGSIPPTQISNAARTNNSNTTGNSMISSNWARHQLNIYNPFPYALSSPALMPIYTAKQESITHNATSEKSPIFIDLTEEDNPTTENVDRTINTKVSTTNTTIPKVVTCFTAGIYPHDNIKPSTNETLKNKNSLQVPHNKDTTEILDKENDNLTQFYDTQPSWMSNVAWCWHQSERDIFKNNISTQTAENADEIILEECIAYDNGIDAVAKVRDKYKEDISNLSPVEVEKINRHSSYIDTALKLKLDIKNIKQRKKAFLDKNCNFLN